MHPQMSLWLETLAAAIPLGVAGMLLAGLNAAMRRRGDDAARRRATLLKVGLPLAAWFALTAVLAFAGLFGRFTPPPPLFLFVLPAIVAAVLLSRSKGVGALLPYMPLWWPIALQSFRILMEVMLFALFVEGIAPRQMTFEGLNFDIVTGVSAIVVAYLVARRAKGWRVWAYAFNAVGLLLLITVFTVAILATPLFNAFAEGPANTVVATWPAVWTPVFIIPAALFLHLLSLRRLRLGESSYRLAGRDAAVASAQVHQPH